MAIVVNATCCVTPPRWLNGYICASHGAIANSDVTSSNAGNDVRMRGSMFQGRPRHGSNAPK
jgi:hypothetical protein